MKKFIFCLILLAVSILSSGMSVIEPERGETEFMKACTRKSPAEVEAMLGAGMDVNLKTRVYKKVALDYALGNTRPFETISLLLKHGADLSLTPDFLMNAMNRLSYYFPDRETTIQLEKVVLFLLEQNPQCDLDEVLAKAAASCKNERIFEKLLNLGANVNSRTTERSPPLISALGEKTNQVALKFLLEHGADPNIRNTMDEPATYFAKSNEDLKLLLKYGADLGAAQLCTFDESGYATFSSIPDGRNCIIKPVPQLNAWAKWIDAENLALALEKNCIIDEKGMIEAAANPNLPELYTQLVKVYGQKPPLSKMAQKAIEYGLPGNIEFLKQNGADADLSQTNLFSSVFNSHYMNNLEQKKEMLGYLIQNHAPINAVDTRTGATALMNAAMRSDLGNARFLLENGADATIFDANGFNVLFHLLSWGYRGDKESASRCEMLELFLKHGAQLKQKNKGVNLLLTALASEQAPELVRRLVELGEDVNFTTGNGITPLMFAAMLYKSDIVELLIQKGAKINVCDITGWSPLFYACHYFFEPPDSGSIGFTPRNRNQADLNETVQVLLKNGSDGTALDNFGASALTEAAAWVNADTMKLLIQAGGKKAVHACDMHNRNAVFYAVVFNSDLNAVEALLNAGADPNVSIKTGSLPERVMKFGNFHGNFDALQNLHAGSENRKARGFFEPPIFEAVGKNNTALVKLLLEHGADPNLQYKPNPELSYTVLNSFYIPSPEIKEMLLAAGAKSEGSNSCKPIFERNTEQTFRNACKSDDLRAVKMIYSALPQMEQEQKKSFLHYSLTGAAMESSLEIVSFLIQENGGAFEKSLIFRAASNSAHPEVLRYLAGLNPAALKGRDSREENSVMHYATGREIIDFLLENGINIDTRNKQGETPLLWLFSSSNHRMLRRYDLHIIFDTLIRRGADVNACNNSGEALLAKVFFSSGHENQYLKYLLKKGANPNTKFGNKVLLEHAIVKGDAKKFEILIEAGADVKAVPAGSKRISPYIARRIEELKRSPTSARKD